MISVLYETPLAGKKSWGIYNKLIEDFGDEFNILLNISKEEMTKKKVDSKLIDLILRSREGKVKVKPGFDGEYGKVLLGNFEKQGKLI